MTQWPVKTRWQATVAAVLLALGFGFTIWGICLIAFSDSTRDIRLGFPIALWGVLLGAFALHGSRWTHLGVAAPEASSGGRLELRQSGEVERRQDTDERREYELRLELMLRRQLELVLHDHITVLRQDVAELRGEVLEAVEGRMLLERTETTRIFGSDLAALQSEIKRLNLGREVSPEILVASDSGLILGPGAPSASALDDHFVAVPNSNSGSPMGGSSALTPVGLSEPSTLAEPSTPAEPSIPAEPSTLAEPSTPADAEPTVGPGEVIADTPAGRNFTTDPFAGLPRLSSFRLAKPPPQRAGEAAPVSGAEPVEALRKWEVALQPSSPTSQPPQPATRTQPPAPAHHAAPTSPASVDEYVGRRRRAAANGQAVAGTDEGAR